MNAQRDLRRNAKRLANGSWHACKVVASAVRQSPTRNQEPRPQWPQKTYFRVSVTVADRHFICFLKAARYAAVQTSRSILTCFERMGTCFSRSSRPHYPRVRLRVPSGSTHACKVFFISRSRVGNGRISTLSGQPWNVDDLVISLQARGYECAFETSHDFENRMLVLFRQSFLTLSSERIMCHRRQAQTAKMGRSCHRCLTITRMPQSEIARIHVKGVKFLVFRQEPARSSSQVANNPTRLGLLRVNWARPCAAGPFRAAIRVMEIEKGPRSTAGLLNFRSSDDGPGFVVAFQRWHPGYRPATRRSRGTI